MNLLKYLETYAAVPSALARFFVILIHMPILMLVIAMHVTEAIIRGIADFALGIMAAIGNGIFGTHTAIINGFRMTGAVVLKVAKGPAKLVAPVANELKAAADHAIASIATDEAEAEKAPQAAVQHVEAAVRGLVNGSPLPAKVAPVSTTTVAGQAPVVHV